MSPSLPALEQRFAADLAKAYNRIATLETQMTQAIGAFAAFACTSATRPATPRTGQEIYETDTGNMSLWTGTAWETIVHEGAWTPYNPTWTCSGTAPAIGNGSLLGSYTKIGRACTARVNIVGGTTTTWGTGSFYALGLPVAAATAAGAQWVGSWYALRSGVANHAGTSLVASGGSTVTAFIENSGAQIGPTGPATWATTDVMAFGITYETAT